MLGLPQQNVAGDGTLQPAFEPARIVQEYEAFSFVRKAVHEAGGHEYVAEADDAAEVMQGDLQALLPLHVDAHGVVLQVRVGIWSHDIKGVLDGVHEAILRT